LAAVVTDLDAAATNRAIVSLGAELARRERLLQQRGLNHLSQLTGADRVPRLLVVIDEFRALIEAEPDAEARLERLAAQGRSLGMHLVLATQRPAGAVSAQLRANLALRLCFRVAQETDSLDVIGSAQAAHINPDQPGTAYLASAGRPTQMMRALLAHAPQAPPAQLQIWPQHWAQPASGPLPSPEDLVISLGQTAQQLNLAPATAPWQPALPNHLALNQLPPGKPNELVIGLLDQPETLDQGPLAIKPAGGNLLIVGARRSGRTTAAHTVATAALRQGCQVHVISNNPQAFSDLSKHPCFGSLTDLAQPRLIRRLVEIVSQPGQAAEQIVLIADDADGLANLIMPGSLDHPLESIKGSVWLVATCLARGASARWTGQFPQRLALPTVDRTEDLTAGVPSILAGARSTPGRVAVLTGSTPGLAQIALACPQDLFSSATPITSQTKVPRLRPVPSQVEDLPPAKANWLWLGRGGDFAEPLGLPLGKHGRLGVIGPPGSGRSTALALIAEQFQANNHNVCLLNGNQANAWQLAFAALENGDAVLFDDAEAAGPNPGEPPANGWLVLATTTRAAGSFTGVGPLLRARPAGLLLWPGTLGSAEALGLRPSDIADPGAEPRPGRGLLVSANQLQPIQVAKPLRAVADRGAAEIFNKFAENSCAAVA
ncbi:MAG: hypothetical protein LBG70_00920, partial [Bifidobacteriaceae bacterium]|nr:hypothetical protein [Bifidobacteriaceae bacterium]